VKSDASFDSNSKYCGVIAGNSDFPIHFLKEAAARKKQCVVIGLKGEADARIEQFGFPVHWVNIGHLNELIKIFKQEHIMTAVMCGQVVHTRLFTEIKLDFRAVALLVRIRDKKTDTILRAVVEEFEKEGIHFISSITFMDNVIPSKKGVLNAADVKLTDRIQRDLDIGFSHAKAIAGLDLGQTVVVKDGAVVAVEGIEGTDKCILRAHELAGDGIVVVKVSKPKQDARFDVPVIGLRTFETLAQTNAAALAFEAGKTLFFDIEQCMHLAQQYHIAIIGM